MIIGSSPCIITTISTFFPDFFSILIIASAVLSVALSCTFEDPNEVKVVIDNNNNALYFSREPIPSRRKGVNTVPMYKQVCIIPFKRDYLLQFNETKQTPLEIIESIDMLRTLENRDIVKMVYAKKTTYSVDTKEDLENVEKLMKSDSLVKKYI